MRKSRFSETQIVGILRDAESGVPVPDLLRTHGVSKATFFKWRSNYVALVHGATRQGWSKGSDDAVAS